MKLIIDITPITSTPKAGVAKVLENLIEEFQTRDDLELVFFALTAREYLPELRKRFPDLKAPPIPARLSWLALHTAQVVGFPLDFVTGPAEAVISVAWLCLPLKSGVTVAFLHDTIPLSNPEWHSKLNIKLYLGYLKSVEKHADLVIADSWTTKTEIVKRTKIPEPKIVVAYPGLSSVFNRKPSLRLRSEVKKKYKLPESYLVFVGTQEPRKNLAGLINAFARVDRSIRRETKLVLVGGKGWGRKVEKPAFVHEVGYVPEGNLPSLYALGKGAVYPAFKEGFGLPIIEAFAMETPVLTSETSSMAEIASGAAILVNPYVVNDIAQGLTRLLTLSERKKKALIKAGRKRLHQFSFSKMADTIIQEIRERTVKRNT